MAAMPDAPEPHPDVGPPDTKRQYRLTAAERHTVARALMYRIEALAGHTDPADPGELYRLRQLLERLTG